MDSSQNRFDLSLVIACYKEVGHLQRNVATIVEYLRHTTLRFELIFVEDASPDETRAELERCLADLKAQGVASQTLLHPHNMGRGASVRDGMRMALGDVVGFIDIDLEHPVDALLPMMLRLRHERADLVVAKRVTDPAHVKLLRNLSNRVYKWLAHKVLELPVSDTEAGLKIFDRVRILPILDLVKDEHWFWDTEVVLRAHRSGLVAIEHPIIFVRNLSKESTVRLARDTWRYLQALLRIRREDRLAQSTAKPTTRAHVVH